MEKQNNTPKLRFPEFSGSWEVKKLKDKISYIKGFAFQSVFYTSSGIRIVRVSDLGADNIKHDNQKIYIDQVQAIGLDKYLINKNDIIITTVGSKPELLESAVGRGILVNEENEGFLNQNLLKINAQSTYENGFLFGYINSKKYISHIKEIQRGNANQSNITVVDLFDYEVFFPTLPEQQKIATFLSTVDEKLQALKKKKSLLETYKKGAMQRLFSQQIRFKDDEGNDFEDWEVKKLGEVAKRKTLKNKEGNLNVLTISAQLGLISQLEYFNKSVSAKDVTGYYLLEKGDFAYNKSYSKGYPMGAIKCLNRYDKGVVSTLYICFTFNKAMNLSFMEHYFETGLQNKKIENVAQEGARNHGLLNIGLEDFFGIELFISSLPEQTKIANFLTAIDEKINKVDGQIKQTELWKKGLLQGMFC
jgi:type I restriction enzyme S subunit